MRAVHHEQALLTRQPANETVVGAGAAVLVAFQIQQHLKGDRETALSHSMGCVPALW
jgi:hypothetical protein